MCGMWRRVSAVATVGCVLGVGCLGGAGVAGAQRAHRGRTAHSGPVDVLYAGSLVTLMQTTLDAAFHKATGYSVTGIAGGSTELAAEITGGVHVGDVFISASPSTNTALMGKKGGDAETWYVPFATSPLLLGYNPHSRFAATLRTKPWWKVVTKPGFLLGRTNPVTDPKGVLAVDALDAAAKAHHAPALAALAATSSTVFPEQTMVGRLQAGQLDAGFFYAVEASAAKIPTVALAGVRARATYTISVLAHAPHRAAGVAFVRYVLGHKANKILRANGLRPLGAPRAVGLHGGVPLGVRRLLHHRHV